MADKVVVLVQQALKPIKLVKWKVNEGNSISIGCVFLLYEVLGDERRLICKLKSSQAGTVHKILAQEGAVVQPGEGLLEIQACLHPTVMRDMCAECGADLRKEDVVTSAASVPMVHSVPELKVSVEQAQKIGKADVNRLLKDRKLVLLVDLDQTLIHTTNDNIPANIKDVYHFQLYGTHSPWYHTRLRPGTHKFLENMSPYFELHICTFGARNYAHMIAMFLDQDGKLFSQRILSRDECFNPTSKTANLKALFPCGDDLVCIIDDREDVWSYASNLIHVKPYHFFQHTGDINAPPGLDKHENDEKEGVDLTKVNNDSRKIKVNGKINDKSKETNNEEGEEEDITQEEDKEENEDESMEENVKNDDNEDCKNENISLEDTVKESDKEEAKKEDINSEQSKNKDDKEDAAHVEDKKEGVSSQEIVKKNEQVDLSSEENIKMEDNEDVAQEEDKMEDVNLEKNVKKDDKEDVAQEDDKKEDAIPEKHLKNDDKEDIAQEDSKMEDVVSEENLKKDDKEDIAPDDGKMEDVVPEENLKKDDKEDIAQDDDKLEDVIPGENLKKDDKEDLKLDECRKEGTSSEEDVKEIKEPEKELKDVVNESVIEEGNKENVETAANGLNNGKEEKEDEMVEIDDPDDYLLYLEDILKEIHKTFYDNYDKMESGQVPDLKKVIPEVRKNVLNEAKLVFSGLVPTHIKLEQSKAYQVARSLGATVTQDLETDSTHLVAVRPGTAKVNAGRRKKNLKIVTPDWLWACAERWTKVEEKLYNLNNKGSKNRHPPPHCSSPEHSVIFDEITTETPGRKRTASGRFMDTINPLMSFSSADIADMDREVEDIFNESESEGENSNKKAVPECDEVFLTEEVLDVVQNVNSKGSDDSSSSSGESMTGEHPHGWKPHEIENRKRSREDDAEDESTADEFPSTKFRRGEELSSDLDIGQGSNSDGSVEPPDEIDDGDWNMMGAALEREFLSNN